MNFIVWKYYNFDYNFTEISTHVSNWQNTSIGSDNGLVPNMRQAIIGTNGGLCCRRMYASVGLNELTMVLSLSVRQLSEM